MATITPVLGSGFLGIPNPPAFIVWWVGIAVIYDTIIADGPWSWTDYAATFAGTYFIRRMA